MRKEWQDGSYRFKRKSVPRTERQKIRFCTFVFIWEQRARYRLSDLEHALLEVSQMSGIIIELHHDRVLRGRIPRVCTALGMGDGLQKLFDMKWDHFSVTSAAFCGWSHPKPACPKSGFQHPLQNSFKSLLAWLLETQARQCHRTNSCFTECWMGGRSLGEVWSGMASKVGTVGFGGGWSHGRHWAGSEMAPEAQGIYVRTQAGALVWPSWQVLSFKRNRFIAMTFLLRESWDTWVSSDLISVQILPHR